MAWDSFVPITMRDHPRPRVAAFVRRGIPHLQVRARPDVLDTPDILTLHLTYGSVSLYILNVYNEGLRNPGTNSVRHLCDTELDPLVPTVVCGDFNLHHPLWTLPRAAPRSSATAENLVDWAEANSFALLNDTSLPTRRGRTGQADSIIDLTWTNFVADEFQVIQDWDCSCSHAVQSDHNAVTWSIAPFQEDHLEDPSPETGYRIDPARESDWREEFQARIHTATPAHYLSADDVEAAALGLLNCMRDTTAAVMPRRSGRIPVRSPWWKDDCDLVVHELKRARGAYRHRVCDGNCEARYAVLRVILLTKLSRGPMQHPKEYGS